MTNIEMLANLEQLLGFFFNKKHPKSSRGTQGCSHADNMGAYWNTLAKTTCILFMAIKSGWKRVF